MTDQDTTTTRPTATIAAVLVTVDSTATIVELRSSDTLQHMYELIGGGCRCVEVVTLSGDLEIWVDEDGMTNDQPFNEAALRVANRLSDRRRDRFLGAAVFTGGVDDDGELVGISPEVAARVIAVAAG